MRNDTLLFCGQRTQRSGTLACRPSSCLSELGSVMGLGQGSAFSFLEVEVTPVGVIKPHGVPGT